MVNEIDDLNFLKVLQHEDWDNRNVGTPVNKSVGNCFAYLFNKQV